MSLKQQRKLKILPKTMTKPTLTNWIRLTHDDLLFTEKKQLFWCADDFRWQGSSMWHSRPCITIGKRFVLMTVNDNYLPFQRDSLFCSVTLISYFWKVRIASAAVLGRLLWESYKSHWKIGLTSDLTCSGSTRRESIGTPWMEQVFPTASLGSRGIILNCKWHAICGANGLRLVC